MAIKRRENKLQDLAASGIVTNRVSGSIPFTHDGRNSPLFSISEVPDPVPQGKSSFLIAGTELLKNKVEVKVEIIDSEGGVIYTEPVSNYLEGNARRVSIEVYDDTPPGPATMYILAQVDPEEWEDETGTDVTNYPNAAPLTKKGKRRKKSRKKRKQKRQRTNQPIFDGGFGRMTINPGFFTPGPGNDTRFRRRRGRRRRGITSDISDQYNFLQTVKMQIVPTATNTEKILFYQEPRLKIWEIFKPFVSNIAATGSIVVSGSLEGQVINDTEGASSTLDNFGATLNTFRRKRKFKKFAGKGGLSKRKRITRRASPEVDNYSFSSDTFNFDSKHVGAKIELNSPSVNTTQFPTSRYSVPTTGSFEVLKVKNSSTVIPDKPFRIYDTQLAQSVDAPITYASFSIEFDPEVTRSISITNFRSYADARVSNIRTFSGDVFRTKIYRKSEESISDYELFADLPLESSELMLNTLEGTGLERTGYFVSQSDAVNYWEVSQSLVGLTGNDATASAKYDIDTQMDSIHISGSNYGVDEYVQFKLSKSYAFNLEKDVGYDFSAEIYGVSKPKTFNLELGGTEVKDFAEMEVYISGSNIPAQEGNEVFGAKLGVVRISDGSAQKDFGITTGDFDSTAVSSNCTLSFKVNAGQFYIADVSVRPATETGFSPDLFTFTAPMPSNEIRPETYEFLAEFYDVNNNQADAFCFTATGSIFQGSNTVITGDDNVIESNLFIGGETTASGIHLGGVSSRLPETGTAGADGSGFMRTVGYTGYTSASNNSLGGKYGFMFWSGSVLPDSGDNYKGVGLEMVGKSGSFKFKTDPSLFDVRADAFFVGRTGSAFVSGAQGKVEISSSEFHLTPEGNVTASEMILGDKSGGNYVQFAGSTLTVRGDLSVDSIRTPALIGGATSTLSNASASIDAYGYAKFVSASIAGWEITTDSIQDVNATGKGIVITSNPSTPFIDVKEDDDNKVRLYHTSDSNWGIIGKSGGNNIFRFGDTNKIASWNFDDKRLSAFSTSTQDKFGISIDADYQLITFHGDAGDGKNNVGDNDRDNVMLAIGQLTDDVFGIKGWASASGDRIFELSPTRNEIAGWTIGNETLQGGNLVLDKAGMIKSSDYQSDVKGWMITAADNGYAEFENAKIRGTLSTTTFEKESVNAVGGQLFVANSTALTGSAVAAAATTMSVVNASGFSANEVLQIKKVTNTGFNTEYIKIVSASLDGDLSKDELHGRIYVQRALSAASSSLSGSVGDPIGSAQEYEPGQVVVSTGKVGTGYIRLNANPNNAATPYIDIVERTGSNVYDIELKARLGDLSGVAGSRNVPPGFTGFGLMSEVAFLSGSNIKLESPSFLLGDLGTAFVSGSSAKIEVSASKFHLQNDGQLLFGDKANNKYVEWDNSNLTVRGDLAVDQLFTPAQIGGATSTFGNASASISASGQVQFKGDFLLGGVGNGPFLSGSGETNLLEISASNFHLSSSGDLRLGRAPTSRVTQSSAERTNPNIGSGNYYTIVSSSLAASSTMNTDGTGGTKHPRSWFRFHTEQYNSNTHTTMVTLSDGDDLIDSAIGAGGTNGLLYLRDDGSSTGKANVYSATAAGGLQYAFISGSIQQKGDSVIEDTDGEFMSERFANGSNFNLGGGGGYAGNLTISMWVRVSAFSSTNQVLWKAGCSDTGLCLFIYQDDIYWGAWDASATAATNKASTTQAAKVTVGTWHHIVGTYKGTGTAATSRLRLYIDKTQSQTLMTTATELIGLTGFAATRVSIGALEGETRFIGRSATLVTDTSGAASNAFNGWMDDIILSQAEWEQADVDVVYDTAMELVDGTYTDAVVYDAETNSLNMKTKNFVFGIPKTSGSAFISGSSDGNLEISSSNFHVSSSGEVSITGDINATSGNFKGTLTATGGNIGGFALVSSSNSYITSDTDKSSYSDSSAGVYLGTDGIGLGTGQFKVSSAGVITSTSGTIGGWTLGNTTLTAGDILLDEGNELIQIGNATTNIQLDIESNKGVFTMIQDSKRRIEMSDALNYGRKGVRLNNATLEMSASAIGERNSEIGIRFGGEYSNAVKHRNNQANNFFVQKPDTTDSMAFLTRGPYYQAIEAQPSDTLGQGIGYGAWMGYSPNDQLKELSVVHSSEYLSYAAMDVKLQVGHMMNAGISDGIATAAGRFEIQSIDTQNYGDESYIVALCAFADDGTWKQTDSNLTSSGYVEPEKAVSGLFGGGRFIVGNVDLKGPSDSAHYQLDIRGDTDLATFKTHLKVEQSIGINVTPSTTNGRLDAGNDVVAYSSSDKRFKENLIRIPGSLDKVMKLSGYEFDWIPDEENHGYEGHDVGVIAQEVEKVLPEVVTTRDSGYKAVKYEKMIPLLIESIKEQQEQIEELKQKVKSLEGN